MDTFSFLALEMSSTTQSAVELSREVPCCKLYVSCVCVAVR
jgi:hypothetical protein